MDYASWFPGCCKGGTKPIDGAVMLGNEKIFTSTIHHVVSGNVTEPVLAGSSSVLISVDFILDSV